MISDRIKALMRDFNPWWEGGAAEAPEYKRCIYSEISGYVGKRQIIAIVGLRRVGKTVIMKQLIKELVKSGKENVFYFLFDDLIAQNPEVLEDILDYYFKSLAKEGRKYVFLDEIQKVPYWHDIVKRFYDTREDIKFVVSGSSSLQIRKSKESLAGRIFDFYVPILTFREFLEMSGLKIERADLSFQKLGKIYDSNIHRKALMERLFLKYVLRGAFPEIATEEDGKTVRRYIASAVTEKIILEDIPAVFKVEKKDIFFSIMEYCSRETANLLDITNLAKTLSVNYSTAKSYLFYLEKSFVLDMVFNHSKSTAKQLRKNKKVHIAHPCITISLMNYPEDVVSLDEVMGRYAETIVFQHLRLLSDRISFWRTPQKEEVDMILDRGGLLPVEVKYRTSISSADVKNLLKFMEKFRVHTGMVATRELLERKKIDGKEILFIPVWLLLLVV